MATGLTYLCPKDPRHKRVHVVEFTPIINPYGGDAATLAALDTRLAEKPQRAWLWKRTGETFETLTLLPSISNSCCHINIVNGEVIFQL
jgi:hypothetical protein